MLGYPGKNLRTSSARETSRSPSTPPASAGEGLVTSDAAPDFPDFYDDNAVIKSLDVAHLESLLGRLCPLVTRYTGFEFQRKPTIRVYTSKEAYRGAIWSDLKRNCDPSLEREVKKNCEFFAGVFLPYNDALAISPNLINRSQGEIKDVLFHELVHAVQFQTFPEYWAEMNVLEASAKADAKKAKAYDRRIQARMTWVEGHAEFVTRRCKAWEAHRVRNTDPSPRIPWTARVRRAYGSVSCLTRLCTDKSFREKAFQYVHGVNLADTVMSMEEKLDRPGDIARELFETPSRVDWVMDTMAMTSYSHVRRDPDGTFPAKYSPYAYLLMARESALENAIKYKYVGVGLDQVLEQ